MSTGCTHTWGEAEECETPFGTLMSPTCRECGAVKLVEDRRRVSSPGRTELELAHHNLGQMHQTVAGLRALLAEHQELGRVQGNRLDAIERELGETQARLRASQEENRRLLTLLHGYERVAGARNTPA